MTMHLEPLLKFLSWDRLNLDWLAKVYQKAGTDTEIWASDRGTEDGDFLAILVEYCRDLDRVYQEHMGC